MSRTTKESHLYRRPEPDTPLRLKEAVAIAFPAGGMTLSGLRKEIARGRLAVEVIAGKQFTTLADIARMRELCRIAEKDPALTNDQPPNRKRRRGTGMSPKELLLKKLEDLRSLKSKP